MRRAILFTLTAFVLLGGLIFPPSAEASGRRGLLGRARAGRAGKASVQVNNFVGSSGYAASSAAFYAPPQAFVQKSFVQQSYAVQAAPVLVQKSYAVQQAPQFYAPPVQVVRQRQFYAPQYDVCPAPAPIPAPAPCYDVPPQAPGCYGNGASFAPSCGTFRSRQVFRGGY